MIGSRYSWKGGEQEGMAEDAGSFRAKGQPANQNLADAMCAMHEEFGADIQDLKEDVSP